MENQTSASGDTGAAESSHRIFLNYRRSDTEDAAGRLFDALCLRFGDNHVFRDIEDIEPGVDFDAVVHEAVGKCDVLLAVIGPSWLTVADKQGRRRLDNPADYVRIELQVALQREILVVPVLVHEAEMPREEDLPDGLKRLARRQALELSPSRWKYDVGRLIEVLEKLRTWTLPPTPAIQAGQPQQATPPNMAPPAEPAHAEPPPPPPPPPPKPVRRGRRRALWSVGGIAALVVLFAIIGSGGSGGTKSHTATSGVRTLTATNASATSKDCSGDSADNTTQPATINFVNASKAPASIYWLSYTGKRELYETVPPGQNTLQSSYVGNKWVVVKSGACTGMTVAKAGKHTFVIH